MICELLLLVVYLASSAFDALCLLHTSLEDFQAIHFIDKQLIPSFNLGNGIRKIFVYDLFIMRGVLYVTLFVNSGKEGFMHEFIFFNLPLCELELALKKDPLWIPLLLLFSHNIVFTPFSIFKLPCKALLEALNLPLDLFLLFTRFLLIQLKQPIPLLHFNH